MLFYSFSSFVELRCIHVLLMIVVTDDCSY